MSQNIQEGDPHDQREIEFQTESRAHAKALGLGGWGVGGALLRRGGKAT